VASAPEAVVAALASRFGLLSRDPLPHYPDRQLPIARVLSLTDLPSSRKADELIAFARSPDSGLSVVICHPATDGSVLRALCSDRLSGRKPWSCEWRLTDFDTLTSARVKAALAGRIDPIGAPVIQFFCSDGGFWYN